MSVFPANICIVDDDQDFVGFLADYLKLRGSQCSVFWSAEALMQIGGFDQYDFFILDLGLPGIDGVDRALADAGPAVQNPVHGGKADPGFAGDVVGHAFALGPRLPARRPRSFRMNPHNALISALIAEARKDDGDEDARRARIASRPASVAWLEVLGGLHVRRQQG